MKMSSPKVSGQISLAEGSASLVKRALLCREGEFDGMTGPVKVTPELLEGILNRYQEEKAKPQNEHDFAPILLDHDRLVNNVKGRILADGMELAPWVSPEGDELVGLYGQLRVDDPDARAKVESGQYAQLSISFDEETFELFEISFVAVPAAKGSIILSKSNGGSMDTAKKLAHANRKANALAAVAMNGRKNRKATLSRIAKNRTELSKEAKTLASAMALVSASLKAASLKARFSGLVRAGKMLPVELKKLDLKELGTLSEKGLAAVFAAYDARPVASDIETYGQSGEAELVADMSPAKMREAMALQRSGKGFTALAEGEDKDKEMGEGEEKQDAEKEKQYSMGEADHKETVEHLAAAHESLTKCLEKFSAIGADADKLADADKDEEKEMGEEGGEDMAADEDEEEKKKLAAEEKEKEDKLKGEK